MAKKKKGAVAALLLIGGGAALAAALSSKPAKAATKPSKEPPKPKSNQALAQQLAAKYSVIFGVPESLVLAIIKIQSNFNPNATNPRAQNLGGMWGWGQMSLAQARDLTRLYPSTAQKYWPNWNGTGPGLLNPEINTAMTAFSLSISWKRYQKYADPWLTAGLAHHQGRGNVDKFVKTHRRPDGKPGINMQQLPPNGKIIWQRLVQAAETQPVLSALARDTQRFGKM